MGTPFIGEIRTVGFSFAPVGWALCNGQLIAIADNDALFTLIGTTYGGDGQSTFGLPNFQSRVAVHIGTNPNTGTAYGLGEPGGVESVTLATAQLPAHSHPMVGSTAVATEETPQNNVTAQSQSNIYGSLPPFPAMNTGVVNIVGGSQPHDNMSPFGVINFIISLEGIFPPQS